MTTLPQTKRGPNIKLDPFEMALRRDPSQDNSALQPYDPAPGWRMWRAVLIWTVCFLGLLYVLLKVWP